MNQVFLLSARMHPNTGTGYETFGSDTGPYRQGVRVIYSSRDGETIDRTELAVCFSGPDGNRNADYMREASFNGVLSPQNIFKAANMLRAVTDESIQQFRDFPKLLKKELNFPDNYDAPSIPHEFAKFGQALQAASQKGGCVYCDPDTKETALERTEYALALLPPGEWLWSDEKQRYECSIFFDCDNPDAPLQAEDTCTLTFSESECTTIGPMWRFDAAGQLVAGSLPDSSQDEPSKESIPTSVPDRHHSSRHAENARAPLQGNLPRLLRWVSVIVLIAIATGALALATSIGATDRVIYLRITLSSAKPILFAIYGFVVGILIGHRR